MCVAGEQADDERRRGLPARCDKTWFCTTFCSGSGIHKEGTESIWKYVRNFNMYDPMALLASSPQLRFRFFEGQKKVRRK